MCRSKVLLLLRSGVSSLEEACTVFLMCVSKCSITKFSGVKAIIITCALILKKYLKNVMLSTPNYSEGQSFLLIKKVCYRSVLSAWVFITFIHLHLQVVLHLCYINRDPAASVWKSNQTNFRIYNSLSFSCFLYIFKCWFYGMLYHIFITV